VRITFTAVVLAVLPLQPLNADSETPFGVLVEGQGAAETYSVCIACHSEKIIAQQGLSQEDWDELLEWMVDEQGMADLPEPLRGDILAYLTANYGPDRPNFPAPGDGT